MLKKIKSKFYQMNIGNKIIFVYIPLIILPIIFITIITNCIFTFSILNKTKINLEDESQIISNRIDNIFSNTETCINVIHKGINETYAESTSFSDRSGMSFKRRNKLEFVLNDARRIFKDVESITFIDPFANVITTDSRLIYDKETILSSGIVEEINANPQPYNVWLPMQKRDYLVNNCEKPVLTVEKKIYSSATNEVLGFLIVNIKEATFSSIFPNENEDNLTGYFIVDDRNIIISSNNKEKILEPVESTKLNLWLNQARETTTKLSIEHRNCLVHAASAGPLGWKLLYIIPFRNLFDNLYINFVLTLSVLVVTIVIALIATYHFSRIIANPIIQLTKTAQLVRNGHWDISFSPASPDEIGILMEVFNEMILHIKDLLKRISIKQQKIREYEFALLQSQVKPHFLYNAIETINMFICLDLKDNALQMTKSLATFYRLSLSDGNEIITIGEEVKLTESYLSIQKFRYIDYMDYEINIDTDILQFKIPKLTLQPLVENAIYHGIKNKSQKGNLSISGWRKENFIFIEVYDDGIGMSEKKINEILDTKNNPKKTNFGMNCINDRIRLLFGNNSGLDIQSTIGEYTKVSIKLEINSGDNENAEDINCR